MLRSSLAIAALAGLSTPAFAAEVQVASQGPVVEISATETVQSDPDIATIGAGVTTRAPTAVAAMQQNAAAMDKVIARLRALGIPRADIQTNGISLNAQYQYNNGAPPAFLGYDAANQVSVILRNTAKVGQTLDALVAAGANDISGPSFSIDDDKPVRAVARKAAFEQAQARANEYAKLAGFNGLRLLSIEEATSERGPVPFMRNAVMAQAKAPSTPVEPGRVGTAVSVTVKYELVK
ncbi:SIMPL domain-containing protein [Novosphingobium lentum]|uniref:SIMPL domain-containing protein n=1 Tax=Novosphingobium lentum TaxID=145287 RepID=UPI00082E80A5|nr:SIMPL domain-containing protein [Novosphingobium lentum]